MTKAESDHIVAALRELERPVAYMVAPDEGHGFAGRENRLAMFAVVEEFLARHLGGRFQEGAAPEVTERIDTLTVDPATVEMPGRDEKAAQAAESAAPPAVDPSLVSTAVLGYATTGTVMGQQLEIASTVRISSEEGEGDPIWRVATEVSSPMGDASDIHLLDDDTLLPRHRTVAQGPLQIELDFTSDTVSGTMQMGQQEMPVQASLPAPVVGDDSALGVYLAAASLQPGATGFLRTFDVQAQKVRLWRLTATGPEPVEVPAGTFQTTRVAVEPVDDAAGGSTWWLADDPFPLAVRREIILPPQAGGGILTSVLTSVETPQ